MIRRHRTTERAFVKPARARCHVILGGRRHLYSLHSLDQSPAAPDRLAVGHSARTTINNRHLCPSARAVTAQRKLTNVCYINCPFVVVFKQITWHSHPGTSFWTFPLGRFSLVRLYHCLSEKNSLTLFLT